MFAVDTLKSLRSHDCCRALIFPCRVLPICLLSLAPTFAFS